MKMIKRSDEEWLSLLQDCRKSGLTDRAWCALHDIYPTTFYRAIKRLRNKACLVPGHTSNVTPQPQEVVEIASIDENGILSVPQQFEPTSAKAGRSMARSEYDDPDHTFNATVKVIAPSGFKVELSNETDAAIIRSILDALRSL